MAANENDYPHHPGQGDVKEDGDVYDRANHADNDAVVANDMDSLKEALAEAKDELKRTKDELQRVLAEKEHENVKLVDIEKKLQRFQEEKEKQSAALIETGRKLQAALRERENLMEQEDRIRAMVEEAEKAVKLCNAADSMDETEVNELESDTVNLSETAIIFKAKLQEMKNKVQESLKQQSFLEEENASLREDFKLASEAVNSLPLLQNQLATAQSVSTEKEEKCASLQAQLCRAELTVQEVKSKILSLQDKLIEEQEAAAKHCNEAEQLRITCNEQLQEIEELQKVEKDSKEKLEYLTMQLNKAEEERMQLQAKVKELEEQGVANKCVEPIGSEKKKKMSTYVILGAIIICFFAVFSQYCVDRVATPM